MEVGSVALGLGERTHGWSRRAPVRRVAVIPVAAALVLGLITSGVQAASWPRRLDVPPFRERWMGTVTTLGTLSAIDPAVGRLFLGGKRSVTLGGEVPSAMAWASQAAFAADVAAGRIPPSVHVVMYDPERWSATPRAERLDPVPAMRAFGRLAHDRGYLAVITPHPNLAEVPRAVCTAAVGEPLTDAFLQCGIQAAAARAADVVEVQGQFLETDPSAYRTFVSAAAAQARTAHPAVTVLSGISTTFTDDPVVLYDAWRSVLGVVDGHYLNMPGGVRSRVAVGFLRMVAANPV